MADVTITVRENGPLRVEGAITLLDADGTAYDLSQRGSTIVLCRCGQSAKKPFCDSTHRTCSFSAPERAGS